MPRRLDARARPVLPDGAVLSGVQIMHDNDHVVTPTDDPRAPWAPGYRGLSPEEFVRRAIASGQRRVPGLVVLPGDELERWREGRSVLNAYMCAPEFKPWQSMIARCCNRNLREYHNYGGRGIRVCDRWLDGLNGFVAFYADMGGRPSPQHSIDRINNDGNYEPDNCRWATAIQQCRNRRGNVKVAIYGETVVLAELVSRSGLSRSGLKYRLDRMDPEKAVSAPRGGTKPEPSPTHCRNGHSFAEHSSLRAEGRVCKACERDRYHRRKASACKPSAVRVGGTP